MNIEDLTMTISDLEGVAPEKVTDNRGASDVAAWLDEARKAEAAAEEILGPAIKEAFNAHRTLTGSRKRLFEKLDEFKGKLRGQLAGWIDRGNPVEGYRVQPKWTIIGTNLARSPRRVQGHYCRREEGSGVDQADGREDGCPWRRVPVCAYPVCERGKVRWKSICIFCCGG